jgi:hypothetical protein
MIMRRVRGLKIGLKWFKESCLLFGGRVSLNKKLYSEIVSFSVYSSSKLLSRKKSLYAEGLKNRLSIKYK